MMRLHWMAMAVLSAVVCVCASDTRGEGTAHREFGAAEDCNVAALPAEVQSALTKDYSDWRIQRASDLNSMARGRWAGAKQGACPGLALGAFTAIGATEYALLLVPSHAGDRGYKLVVFKRPTEQAAYVATKVVESDRAKPEDYFIRIIPVEDWADGIRIKKSQIQAPDAIELANSDANEYGAVLYFYTGGKFKSEPIDD